MNSQNTNYLRERCARRCGCSLHWRTIYRKASEVEIVEDSEHMTAKAGNSIDEALAVDVIHMGKSKPPNKKKK